MVLLLVLLVGQQGGVRACLLRKLSAIAPVTVNRGGRCRVLCRPRRPFAAGVGDPFEHHEGASLLELDLMDDAALLLCDTFDALEGDIVASVHNLKFPFAAFAIFKRRGQSRVRVSAALNS